MGKRRMRQQDEIVGDRASLSTSKILGRPIGWGSNSPTLDGLSVLLP